MERERERESSGEESVTQDRTVKKIRFKEKSIAGKLKWKTIKPEMM